MAEKVKPGRELDKLVAEAIGQKGSIALPYSTEMGAAWQAWEWLEENKPGGWEWVLLGLSSISEKPAVQIMESRDNTEKEGWLIWVVELETEGESYPHAIALAVVEADKWLRK